MKAGEGQKRAIFPSLIWGGGGEGGLGFPFILSKIVGLVQFEEQFVFLDKYNIIHQDLDYFLQYNLLICYLGVFSSLPS